MPGVPEMMVDANGVPLCVETFGSASDPTVLLIMGAGSSMLGWPEELCRMLADGGRHVVRYDQRDTGRSITYPPGEAPYTHVDLADDAVGILDALHVRTAHVVGISMGGAVAQVLAITHPRRVATLTLISSSPGVHDPDLPAPDEELLATFRSLGRPDWSDPESAVAHLVSTGRALAAPSAPFDEDAARALATAEIARATDYVASRTNHPPDTGGRWRERLGEITAPTLVVHGAEDPLAPIGHGEALAREIPDARLVPVPGMGHDLPRHAWDRLAGEILAHTAPRYAVEVVHLGKRTQPGLQPDTRRFDDAHGALDHLHRAVGELVLRGADGYRLLDATLDRDALDERRPGIAAAARFTNEQTGVRTEVLLRVLDPPAAAD